MSKYQLRQWITAKKDAISIGLSLLVLIGAIVWSYYYIEMNRHDQDPSDLEGTWELSDDGDYVLKFEGNFYQPHGFISWELRDDQGRLVNWTDPSGEIISMKGMLNKVNYTYRHVMRADITYGNFHSRTPMVNPHSNQNHTLCIVTMDDDDNTNFSDGDSLWIRSIANGGCADVGYSLHLRNIDENLNYKTLTIPDGLG